MKKTPFVTKEQVEEIVKTYPTPFHLYDEKGIRKNAEAVKEAFAWNPGFREYFAVKATPNPYLLKILQEYENKLHLIERFVKIREEVGSIQKLAENPQISKEELIGKVNEISHRIIEEL